MKKARYIIEQHTRAGKVASEVFEGTRVEARKRAQQVRKENDCGTYIRFVRYLDAA